LLARDNRFGIQSGEGSSVADSRTRLANRITRRLPVLTKTLMRDPYAEQSAPIAADTLRLLVRGLHDEPAVSDADLNSLRNAAIQHADEGTPLRTLVSGCHAAARIVGGALLEEVPAEEAALLRGAGERLLRVLEEVTRTVTEAYLEEQFAIRGEERDAKRALAGALISGEHAGGPAARLGVRIAAAYVVLALRYHSLEGEDEAPVAAVAARHRMRRTQEQLDKFTGESVLSLLDPGGGSALLPTDPDNVNTLLSRLPTLLRGIQVATGTTPIAGAAGCVGVIAVSRAAQQARDVLGIAGRLGRPPGVYTLNDVLLEYQLTRDSDARPMLAGLLDPLEGNTDLVQTLESYFGHDLDRRSTAAALHVHPNTLDYRLRRVAQLTGLDPGKPSGQQLLAAALTARRLV
jgi:hypothetical protein